MKNIPNHKLTPVAAVVIALAVALVVFAGILELSIPNKSGECDNSVKIQIEADTIILSQDPEDKVGIIITDPELVQRIVAALENGVRVDTTQRDEFTVYMRWGDNKFAPQINDVEKYDEIVTRDWCSGEYGPPNQTVLIDSEAYKEIEELFNETKSNNELVNIWGMRY